MKEEKGEAVSGELSWDSGFWIPAERVLSGLCLPVLSLTAIYSYVHPGEQEGGPLEWWIIDA